MALGVGGRNGRGPVAAPVVVDRVVQADPERVFDLLDDLDNHDWIGGRWLDVVEVHRSAGITTGADLVLRRPFVADRAASTTITGRSRPDRLRGIVRVPGVAAAELAWDLAATVGGTRVRLAIVPLALRTRDRAWLALGGRPWLRRRATAMLDRLGDHLAG